MVRKIIEYVARIRISGVVYREFVMLSVLILVINNINVLLKITQYSLPLSSIDMFSNPFFERIA